MVVSSDVLFGKSVAIFIPCYGLTPTIGINIHISDASNSLTAYDAEDGNITIKVPNMSKCSIVSIVQNLENKDSGFLQKS